MAGVSKENHRKQGRENTKENLSMDMAKNTNYFSIAVSIIGIVPLAILGLLTPYQFVAFLLGISDASFVGIIAINSYSLGTKSGP